MTTEETELTFIRCPSCRSLVPAVATRCRMCGHLFEGDSDDDHAGDAPKKSRVRQRTLSVSKAEIEEMTQQIVGSSAAKAASAPEPVEEPAPARAESQRRVTVVDDDADYPEAPLNIPEFEQEAAEHAAGDEGYADEAYAGADDADDIWSKEVPAFDEPLRAHETGRFKVGFQDSYDAQGPSFEEDSDDSDNDDDVVNGIGAGEDETADRREGGKKRRRRRRKRRGGSEALASEQSDTLDEPAPEPEEPAEVRTHEPQSPARSEAKAERAAPERRAVERDAEPLRTQDAPRHESPAKAAGRYASPEESETHVKPRREATMASHETAIDEGSFGRSAGRGSKQPEGAPVEDRPGALLGWFVNFSHDSRGLGLEIRNGKFFIGRQALRDDDMVISDSAISTPHCLISASRGEGLKVQDLMSEQGTFLKRAGSNSFTRVHDAVRVEHGDWLRFGSYEVVVCLVP